MCYKNSLVKSSVNADYEKKMCYSISPFYYLINKYKFNVYCVLNGSCTVGDPKNNTDTNTINNNMVVANIY